MAIPIVDNGGFELSPVLGHLGDRERMVKPARNMVGLLFMRELTVFCRQNLIEHITIGEVDD
jgi:hypothetical protein